MNNFEEGNTTGAVAIIGMTGRFPGAGDMDEFWQNLYNGVESVRFFNREELIKMGIDEHLLDNPKFVAADAVLEDMDKFDAAFFDYSAREAEIMDPQHRLFLESAWEVLESAGYNSELYDGRIAVYAGANLSGYMIRNINTNPGLVEQVGTFKIMIANSQDFLATRVSYKMNLTGPSVNVNTLCSSSMVALHMACQNLLNYDCDLALAGGVSFQISRNEAFFYQEGGIGSADGHCRAFDSKANGTVSGSGLAIVVLKRLEDALADGDTIHAVIRGTGINNDGSDKNSFTAPNVDGQAECIAEAIAVSGVDPETITYIDAHGTGTDLGDPIEISALTKAFGAYTKKKQFCALGSVKTNIGHLVTAGGLASLCKTVLAIRHRCIPPSLNFEEPNPKIDFINSPFYINSELAKWETNGYPLRAGVSSFGIGGTNTHVIIEEAPAAGPSERSGRPWQLVSLSAKTDTALDKMTSNLAEYIRKNPGLPLEDIAFTLHAGRRNFNHRRVLVCRDVNDLLEKLEALSPDQLFTRFQKPKDQPVVFMFPGEGLYVNMGLELYKCETPFSSAIDNCAKILQPMLGMDIRDVLYPDAGTEAAVRKLSEERVSRSALFAVEYALAKLWMSWEVEPQSMIGEGVGEYVAKYLTGAMSLEDALLLASGRDSQRTGNGKADRFIDELKEVLKNPGQILLEIGPGGRLCAQANELREQEAQQTLLTTMPDSGSEQPDFGCLLISLGQFWLAGGRVNWMRFYADEKRRRIPLPTYPFERQSYWIEPGNRNIQMQQPKVFISKEEDISASVVNAGYNEGLLTVTLNLDSGDREKQLRDILVFKEKLEEFCKDFSGICTGMQVSPVGLKTRQKPGESDDQYEVNRRPRPALETPYTVPRNETEKIIAGLASGILGFDDIGVNDDFFELGGHSLLAVAFISKLRKKFRKDISLEALFENTTVAKLAEIFDPGAAKEEEPEDYEEGQL